MRWIFLLSLVGCGFIDDDWFDENVRDVDGDGLIAERFGGPDCDDLNPDIGDCDVDQDGFRTTAVGGEDCDDNNPDVHPNATERCDLIDNDCDGLVDNEDSDVTGGTLAFPDLDGDGYGTGTAVLRCPLAHNIPPEGASWNHNDCDDTAATIHPNAAEFCNEIDEDCDGQTYDFDALDALGDRLVDADSDGYASGAHLPPGCLRDGQLNPHTAPEVLDCDDTDSHIYPGAPEVFYDGIDQGCDGPHNDRDADQDGFADDVDCDDSNPHIYPGAPEICDGADNNCNELIDGADPAIDDPLNTYWRDGDGDGFGDPTQAHGFCPGDLTNGWVISGSFADCDDTLDHTYPLAPERCDGIDNDCNGIIDDNAVDALALYIDLDGDGFGAAPTFSCRVETGITALPGDCDDTSADIYPGAPEVCGDGLLQDCAQPERQFDCDGDGVNDVLLGGHDCDDSDPQISPDIQESCDNRDNDCDGDVDEDAIDASFFYIDVDGDGFGAELIRACALRPGLSDQSGDCNDSLATTFPGAFEVCGDQALQNCDRPSGELDCDGDGGTDVLFPHGTDCDDSDSSISANAPEICDNKDNDCDGLIDADDPSVDLSTAPDWFLDEDGDGFGDPAVVVAPATCSGPTNAAPNSDDCDDSNPLVGPGQPELCDGIDNDCDGEIDEGTPVDVPTYYFDADGDGFGNAGVISTSSCLPPSDAWVTNAADCDDVHSDVYPGAIELCDGYDNDCDLSIDDADTDGLSDFTAWHLDADGDGAGQHNSVVIQCDQPAGYVLSNNDCDDNDPHVLIFRTWYRDSDGDGFGDANDATDLCTQPVGYALISGDCDDSEAQISPATPEVCDGVDNDCDGDIDDEDSLVASAPRWYADNDRDLWGGALLGASCASPPDASPFTGDCDDSSAQVNPGEVERCDGIDNDCDGLTDDEDTNVVGRTHWFTDQDADGHYGTDAGLYCVLNNASQSNNDCDDSKPEIYFGAAEVCDGLDNDCDGQVDLSDNDAIPAVWVYADQDHDGYGIDTLVGACTVEPGWSEQDGDCNDGDAAIYPGAPHEVCDHVDTNCDGSADDELFVSYGYDQDGDSYTSELTSGCEQELSGQGLIPATTLDCDDGRPDIHPGAPEVCDGRDQNCDGDVDEGVLTELGYDNDGDSYTRDNFMGCLDPSNSYAPASQEADCNDWNPNIHPSATEICNYNDDDCDGLVDEADDSLVGNIQFYLDHDGDGFGVADVVTQACDLDWPPPAPPAGMASVDGDCDDADPAINPDTPERCNDSTDNDCDGLVDNDDPSASDGGSYRYPDLDGDGWGGEAGARWWCSDPGVDWIPTGGDCDDDEPLAPQPNGLFVVDTSGSTPFGDLQNALDVACVLSGTATVEFHESFSGDFVVPNRGNRVTLDGKDSGTIEGTLRVETNTTLQSFDMIADARPAISATNSLTIIGMDLVGIAGSGPLIESDNYLGCSSLQVSDPGGESTIQASDINISNTELTATGTVSTGIFSPIENGNISASGLSIQGLYEVGLSADAGQGYLSIYVYNATILATSSPYTIATSLDFFDLSFNQSILGGGGPCNGGPDLYYNDTFSNQPTCTDQQPGTGLQTYHPELDPALWDLHPHLNSAAYTANAGYWPNSFGPDFITTPAGLPQYWETLYGIDCTDPTADHDADGLSCTEEYANGTVPTLSDTDGDGAIDSHDFSPLNPSVQ